MSFNQNLDLAGRVIVELRSLLFDATLRVGMPLKEVELAARLEVSRTPVREALARLAASGIVERQGRSYVVAELDAETEAEAMQVRAVLEPLAARLAAERVTTGFVAPAELSALDRTVDDLRSAADLAEAHAAARANHDFHAGVVHLAGNDVLASTVGPLNDRLTIATLARLESPDWAHDAADQHEAIALAIRQGDAEMAAATATSHIASISDMADRHRAD